MRVLILCTGNSCRSQMAHGFLQSFDKNIEVYSGGTDPAAQVNTKAVEVMKEVGIDISSHVPTHVNTYLDQEWDYVITESGTANQLSFDMYCSKNPSGTKPCINAPIPIPIRM